VDSATVDLILNSSWEGWTRALWPCPGIW